MKKEDFYEYQKTNIDKLIANDVIIIENEVIHLNPYIVKLVYEFYHKEVICYNYSKCEILDQWIAENKVSNDSKLFSRNESNYINFMLNQAEFSNGLDLRNRYTHDTCSTNEKVHQNDYFMLLKIMILFVIKINEEFCLKSES